MEDIRKRSKILVVDDTDFAYLPLFHKDGYSVDKWDDIQDLQKLESGYYDIILLDIQGVGRELSREQGFGILKHLRETSPTQIIIAYSNADFSLQYHDFFKLADDTLAKSSDYVQFKRIVDHLLQEKFSLGFYLSRVRALAGPYHVDSERLETLARTAILRGRKARFRAYLESHIDNKDTIGIILQVVEVAIAIAAL